MTTKEQSAIIAEYAKQGIETCTAKGGFFVNGRGFVSLRNARKETGINMAQRREGKRISAYGDWATVAYLNRAEG